MLKLIDENLNDLSLIEGALALNIAINPDIQRQFVDIKLRDMCIEAEQVLAHECNDQQRLERLLQLFYVEWGFQGDIESYFNSDNAFINHVIENKKGIPVTLGVIFLHLCEHVNLTVSAINFPTQLVLKVELPEQPTRYLNPFDGQYVDDHIMTAWLIGHGGPLAKILPMHLDKTDNLTLIGRLLAVIKTATIRERKFSLALTCSDLAITMAPDDPFEIRDRGLIYQQLECTCAAKKDLEYFIEQCPDDPSVFLIKEQVRLLKQQYPTVLH